MTKSKAGFPQLILRERMEQQKKSQISRNWQVTEYIRESIEIVIAQNCAKYS